jgi:hypothetical protein
VGVSASSRGSSRRHPLGAFSHVPVSNTLRRLCSVAYR